MFAFALFILLVAPPGCAVRVLPTLKPKSTSKPTAWDGFIDTMSSATSSKRRNPPYFEMRTSNDEIVRAGISGSATRKYAVASVSKLFIGFAAMCTMELKPNDFYPEKFLYEFKGYEKFKDFDIIGGDSKANLTVHHLLTHTSGLPFRTRVSRKGMARSKLFFQPGTGFGYSVGHRLMGWILRDFWKDQAETNNAKIKSVRDTLEWLFFSKLQISNRTGFSKKVEWFITGTELGDAGMKTTGDDVMRLLMVALRKGKLANGTQIISEANWNKWAVQNLLPEGKLSSNFTHWKEHWGYENLNYVGVQVMKDTGPYGWNYFGATFNNSQWIGWCGTFGSCAVVSYAHDLAIVLMQKGGSFKSNGMKEIIGPWYENTDIPLQDVVSSLQCRTKPCRQDGEPSVFCETGNTTLPPKGHLDDECHPSEKKLIDSNGVFRCYVPRCSAKLPQ